MNSILVLKDKALNATGVTSLNNFQNLAQGALAIVLDSKALYTGAESLANVERIQFIAGVAPASNELGETINTLSVSPIPRRQVTSVDYEKYKEPRVRIVQFGPFNWEQEGDAGIQLNNNSYVGTIKTGQVRANFYKKSSDTELKVVQKLVEIINTNSSFGSQLPLNTFCKAEVVGTTPANLKIKVTMLSEHVNFSYSLQGMLALAPEEVLQKEIISLGVGRDVMRTEEEYSGNLGNGGYWGYNEGYFKKPLEAIATEKYDIFNITWKGMHDDPQNRHAVARNHLMIAVPTNTALVDQLKSYMSAFFGSAFSDTVGALVPGSDDSDETNGTPIPQTNGID